MNGRVVGALLLFGLVVVIAEGWARNARDYVIAAVGGTVPNQTAPPSSPAPSPQSRHSSGPGFNTF